MTATNFDMDTLNKQVEKIYNYRIFGEEEKYKPFDKKYLLNGKIYDLDALKKQAEELYNYKASDDVEEYNIFDYEYQEDLNYRIFLLLADLDYLRESSEISDDVKSIIIDIMISLDYRLRVIHMFFKSRNYNFNDNDNYEYGWYGNLRDILKIMC